MLCKTHQTLFAKYAHQSHVQQIPPVSFLHNLIINDSCSHMPLGRYKWQRCRDVIQMTNDIVQIIVMKCSPCQQGLLLDYDGM